MHNPLPVLLNSDFPQLQRERLQVLQANLGYRCNQACLHCHVAASPKRREAMSWETMQLLLQFAQRHALRRLDLTGGAPELNPQFRALVGAARALGLEVIDRCNLTILSEPGQHDLAAFLAEQQVEICASLPCYLEENVDQQRGNGVFSASLAGLRQLNALGYGQPGSGLRLNLVYNPLGPSLPPAQVGLEMAYKQQLAQRYGIVFNQLLTLTNMPIQRFASQLISQGVLQEYLQRLKDAYQVQNLPHLMCRSLVSVDWQGYVYDCDFNQMLRLPLGMGGSEPLHLQQLLECSFEQQPIRVAQHCYACTAGQGSSCGGALS